MILLWGRLENPAVTCRLQVRGCRFLKCRIHVVPGKFVGQAFFNWAVLQVATRKPGYFRAVLLLICQWFVNSTRAVGQWLLLYHGGVRVFVCLLPAPCCPCF